MQRFIDERNPDQFILYFWNKGWIGHSPHSPLSRRESYLQNFLIGKMHQLISAHHGFLKKAVL
jgi:hypothetical protein